MERVKRRFWTWAVSTLAVCVIVGAAVSGLFQLAVLALPSYRQDLSAWVTDVAGRPVQIGGVSLVWRGIYPRLDLSDITLYDDDGDEALSAERLSLGFGLWGLLRGEWLPSRIELAGMSIAVDVNEQGQVSVAGIETLRQGDAPRTGELLDALRRFQFVRLENCEVRLTHARLGKQELQFTLARADVDRTTDGFEVDGELRLPPTHGGAVSFSADIAGDVADPRVWNGDFEVEADGLRPQPWLAPWLATGTQVAAENLNLHLTGHVAEGPFDTLQVKAESDALLIARVGHSSGAHSMKFAASLAQDAGGWSGSVSEFLLDAEAQLTGSGHLARGADGTLQLDADADLLRLSRLAPLAGFVRDASPGLLALARTGGEADNFVVRLRKGAEATRYSLKATLKDLSLAPDERVGFTGLNAELSADESGGRIALGGGGVTLMLPQALPNAVPFAALTGELRWERAAPGWNVTMPGFGWDLEGSTGKGRLALLLPDDAARSPELDLAAGFSVQDVTRFKPYMPLHWGPGLHKWLERSIQRGRVPNAELTIHGPLRDFPFNEKHSGEWSLDLDAANVRLAYLPDWPVVDNIGAHLAFRGNGLAVEADRATVMGNPVQHAEAAFPDFGNHEFTVDAQVAGEISRFYEFLKSSPLRAHLSGLVDNTTATGPASVQVHLDIPLDDGNAVTVGGTVGVQDADLHYQGLEQPVRGITGDIAFTEHSVTAKNLRAQFEDLALNARIEPREGLPGVVLIDFLLSPQADGSGASGFIPPFVRGAMSGQSRWRAELPLGGDDVGLLLTSSLEGTAIGLPPPVAKSAESAAPIRVHIGGDPDAPVRIRVGYDGRLGADIALGDAKVQHKVRAVSLHLGGGAAEPAKGDGIRIDGEVAELDFAAWGAALHSSASDVLGGLAVRDAELTAGHVMLGSQTVGPTHLRYEPLATGWRTALKGAGAEGNIVWSDADGGRVTARLDHLALDTHAISGGPDAGERSATRGTPADPAKLPVLDLECDHLVAGGADLGRLELRSARIANGQRLEALKISGGKLDATIGGQWQRSDGKSTADARFELDTTDIAAVLRGLDYTPTLSAKHSRFTGDLAWSPAAGGIDWEQAAGHIVLDVDNGVIKTVEPGAGRVLGLINFYALPRRLTLDFRDVVSSGLSFDKVTGGFDLKGGEANTQDLKIAAPSLRMEVRGRVGLVARDYDQQVSVYPDVSAGVTLGAVLLGGPALGALVLLAQEVLDKPLDQVTQLSYHLTGTWDNPKVEKTGGEHVDKPEPHKDLLPPLAPLNPEPLGPKS
jgi:uncharacterized protein (TIGR02099 family)